MLVSVPCSGRKGHERVYNDSCSRVHEDGGGLVRKHPVIIDKYVNGIEAEVDGICDCEDVLIPGIFQHIERAVHCDSIADIRPTRFPGK